MARNSVILFRRRVRDGFGLVPSLLTPVLTWDGNTVDLSPNYTIDLDPTAAVDDVLTFWTSETSDFASYIQETYALVIGDLGGSASFASADLTAGTYYVKVKHTRPSPAYASDWSNVVTVTIVTRAAFSGFTMILPGTAERTALGGFTMTHIGAA